MRASLADLPAEYQEQARAQFGERGSPRKYRNEPIRVGDMRFDSKLEHRCWQWLEMRRQAGEIAWIIRQVPFELEGGIRYRADFLVVLSVGGVEVIDAKAYDTQASRNKRRQVASRYGVHVQLWPSK